MCKPKTKSELRKEFFLQQAKDMAIERGGKCLSEEYHNNRTKMRWECSEGHQWDAIYDNIINNKTWCPDCSGKKKKTIEDCIKVAEERGGKCLSDEYHNNNTNMSWECSEGHQWDATYNNIQRGTWCPHCAGKHITIEDCIKVAEERGGKCLSDEYHNHKTKMLWECSEGHQWDACFNEVKNNKSWCPYCAGKHITLEDCIKVAEERGGKCLSDEYIDARAKMKWECSEGHQWDAIYDSIQRGTWCPHCNYKNETNVKEILEFQTNLKFRKIKPKWLINSRGNRMEFDGYVKEHKIAFEYHGEQHYEYNPYFHRNGEYDLLQRQEDDKLKEQLAKEHGVRLIVIPYYVDDLETFIYEELMKVDPSLIKLNLDKLINVEECSDIL